jgi:hypothetical protein
MSHMNVHPRFFSGEEKEPEWSFPKNCRCHASVPAAGRFLV